MRCSTFSFVVFAVLSVLLAGCASLDGTGEEISSEADAICVEPPAPELRAAEEEIPVEILYSFGGNTLDIKAYETCAVVSYTSDPGVERVEAFLAEEAGKYPEAASYLTYKLVDNTVALTYAGGISEGDRRAFATILANDIYEASGAVGTLFVEHMTGDGSIKLFISDDGALVIGYMDYLSDEALGHAITAGNVKYGSVLGGFSFEASGFGTMGLKYPETVSKADVASFAQLVVTGLRRGE